MTVTLQTAPINANDIPAELWSALGTSVTLDVVMDRPNGDGRLFLNEVIRFVETLENHAAACVAGARAKKATETAHTNRIVEFTQTAAALFSAEGQDMAAGVLRQMGRRARVRDRISSGLIDLAAA